MSIISKFQLRGTDKYKYIGIPKDLFWSISNWKWMLEKFLTSARLSCGWLENDFEWLSGDLVSRAASELNCGQVLWAR